MVPSPLRLKLAFLLCICAIACAYYSCCMSPPDLNCSHSFPWLCPSPDYELGPGAMLIFPPIALVFSTLLGIYSALDVEWMQMADQAIACEYLNFPLPLKSCLPCQLSPFLFLLTSQGHAHDSDLCCSQDWRLNCLLLL